MTFYIKNFRKKMHQNRLKHFVLCSKIYTRNLKKRKAFFNCGSFGRCRFSYLLEKGEPEPRGFEKVIVHTSQQTTLLSKTGFRPVFSCAPLLLLFPKKLTLFGDPDKKRRMSFCFHTKTEGIRTREGMSVIRMSCDHSNSV